MTGPKRYRVAFFRGPSMNRGLSRPAQRRRALAMAEDLQESGAAGIMDMNDGTGFVLLKEPADELPAQTFIGRIHEASLVDSVEVLADDASLIAQVAANPSLLQGPDMASRQNRRELVVAIFARLQSGNQHRRFPVLKSYRQGHAIVALGDISRTLRRKVK